jgi:hypothetical protein
VEVVMSDVTQADILCAAAVSRQLLGFDASSQTTLTIAHHRAAAVSEATAAKDAEIARLEVIVRDLAALPPGGEVWDRSKRLADFTLRARAIEARPTAEKQ